MSKAVDFAARITGAGLKVDQGLFGATLRLASAKRAGAEEATRGLVAMLPFEGLKTFRGAWAQNLGWVLEERLFVQETLWPLVVSCLGRAGALDDALSVCSSLIEADPKRASSLLDAYVDACQVMLMPHNLITR